MYSFLDIQFWLYFIYFFLSLFLSVVIPGYIVLRFLPVKSVGLRLLLSFVVGVVMWGIQGYILGYLQIRIVSYLYIAIFFLLFIKYRKMFLADLFKIPARIRALDKVVFLLITIGMVLQAFPIFASGMVYEDGVRFFHVNGTDGILHLGYIQSMVYSFPPEEPGINAPLVNYHYWSDLVIAEFARVWHLPVIHLFFQYFVPVISLVTGIAVYLLIQLWGGSKTVARWALFLLYFGGDAAYIFMLLLHQQLSFSTPAIDNGILQFLNMPHAMAKMIFITGLIPLWYWVKNNDNKFGVITILLFAALVGFKVYYGIFVALGLLFLFGTKVLQSIYTKSRKYGIGQGIGLTFKEYKTTIGLLLIFGVCAAAIYFPPNKASGGLFFAPLEWPKLLLASGSLDFEEWWLRRQVYESVNNIKALVLYDAVAVGIALVAIYGTRLLGFIPNRALIKNLGAPLTLFFVPTTLIFNFLGFYTLQESGLFNVYNFFVVSIVILSLFAAFTLARIQKIKIIGPIFAIIFIVATVPRVLHEGQSFIRSYTTDFNSSAVVSNSELEALIYLKENTERDAIIQTHPRNGWDQITPYSVFFAQRNSYITGAVLLETHNQPTEERTKELVLLFDAPNSGEFAQKMKELNISYVLVKKDDDQKIALPIDKTFLKTPFENSEYMILENSIK